LTYTVLFDKSEKIGWRGVQVASTFFTILHVFAFLTRNDFDN
jgi:hypothetical protein